MIWDRRPGPRMKRTFKQARATYISNLPTGYTLRWVGSTHGVWTVEHDGQSGHVAVCSTLRHAKAAAEHHLRARVERDHASR